MIAFALADLRDWLDRRMAKTIVVSALMLGSAGMAGPLHPEFQALAGALVFIIFGWTEGYRYRATEPKRLLLIFPRPARQLVAGKAISLFINWIVLVSMFSPLLVASALLWGTSLRFFGSYLLCAFAAHLVSGAAGLVLSLASDHAEGLVGYFLLIVWTLSGYAGGWFRMVNPFFQILELSQRTEGLSVFIGLIAEVFAAVAFFVLAGFMIARARRRHHE